jgi:hypothetical protein
VVIGRNASVGLPASEGSESSRLSLEVFVYPSAAALTSRWTVEADGTARSDACGYVDDVLAAENVASAGAGNIVVVTHEAEHEAWPRLVAVLDELGGRTE